MDFFVRLSVISRLGRKRCDDHNKNPTSLPRVRAKNIVYLKQNRFIKGLSIKRSLLMKKKKGFKTKSCTRAEIFHLKQSVLQKYSLVFTFFPFTCNFYSWHHLKDQNKAVNNCKAERKSFRVLQIKSQKCCTHVCFARYPKIKSHPSQNFFQSFR